MMEILLEVRAYREQDYTVFKEMFKNYFTMDFNIQLNDEQFEEVCTKITQSASKHIVFLDFLFLNGIAKGFIEYQVDSPASDWCENEYWGFIREIFVTADVRGKGYGKVLAAHAEHKLWELSVPSIYLTTDGNLDFWTQSGYRDTGEVCAKNDGCILVKYSGSHNR